MNQLSEELHMLKQHVDSQFALEREHTQRVLAEFKAELIELISEKFDAARKETDAKLTEFRKDMDRKFMWMIAGLVGVMAGLVGVIAGQVALFFR